MAQRFLMLFVAIKKYLIILLYPWLLLVKEWRNNETHISPTATEEELHSAISIIATLYCYATGSCITDLERNGHDLDNRHPETATRPMYAPCTDDETVEQEYDRAAECIPASELTEQQKIDVLRKSMM